MLLIYSTQTTTRLQYICKFIFEEILGTAYSLTTHKESFEEYAGSKINYSNNRFSKNYFQLKPHLLLFEENIRQQNIACFGEGENKVFFTTEAGDYPFDIFAAAFYLISRYEEYLPHAKDIYGRYAHGNSLAFKENFLHIPLVNYWIKSFAEKLRAEFPGLIFKEQHFTFLPTYDIDIAWSYKQKGFLRNIGGFIKSPSADRIASLLAIKQDPYDSYTFLDGIHTLNTLTPLYFFLMANKNGLYDKNILPDNKAMQQLIKAHAGKYNIGLHPSWQSYDTKKKIEQEKKTLENIAEKKITSSRQHYIKLNIPETYQQLILTGITADYSMGYGSINGFRASIASSFFWYDLSSEKITTLRIHPFCFMDANCFYEQKLSVAESYDELMHYFMECKKVFGTLITIFHNNFLGTDKIFSGWKELYSTFISQVQ